jgi:hypothetical protein
MKIFLTLAIFLLPVSAIAESIEGTWEIEVVSEGKDQFPWWQQIKYPAKLVISKTNDAYSFEFTDQYKFTCTGTAMSVNNGKEVVFEFCSGLGTKSEMAWGPIHHAKLVQGRLQGAVTTNQHLFNWAGTRVQQGM